MTSVLLVEDDPQFGKTLSLTLRGHGYTVSLVPDGLVAVSEIETKAPDVVLLDLGLPGLDGLEVIRFVRRQDERLPIVVLSARRDQSDKVHALDAGADDYLTKPFGIEELLARLRAAVRRRDVGVDRRIVETADFAVDLGRKRVLRQGLDVHLTPTEWGILEVLVRADGMLVSGPDLLREVWGPSYQNESHYLRVYLAQLRRKLEPDPALPRYLVTAPRLGYRFDARSGG